MIITKNKYPHPTRGMSGVRISLGQVMATLAMTDFIRMDMKKNIEGVDLITSKLSQDKLIFYSANQSINLFH